MTEYAIPVAAAVAALTLVLVLRTVRRSYLLLALSGFLVWGVGVPAAMLVAWVGGRGV